MHRICCASGIVQRCSGDVCSVPHVQVRLRAGLEPEASAPADSLSTFCLVSGRSLSSWAQRFRSRDFQLLCRDGTRANVTEWRRCHLARVPARAVVVRPDTDGTALFQLLNQGQVGGCFFIALRILEGFSQLSNQTEKGVSEHLWLCGTSQIEQCVTGASFFFNITAKI